MVRPAFRPDDEPDDLSSDALDYQEAPSAAMGQVLIGLVVLLVAVLGAPALWADLESGDIGLAAIFFPVLGAAFGSLAVSRR